MGQKCASDISPVKCDRQQACTNSANTPDHVYGMTCGYHHAFIPSRDPEQGRVVSRRLWDASVAGDVDKIKAAIEAGADIEARKASNSGIRMQVRQTSRFFGEDDKVVHQTLSNEPEETIEFVGGVFHRLQGADQGVSSGQTPLMLAAKAGRPQAVAALLEMRGNPYLKDEMGMQPLHHAASASCRECCKALLHARASPAVLDNSGRDAFACLSRSCIADQFDRVQWAALLGVPLHNRSFSEDFHSHQDTNINIGWASLGTVFESRLVFESRPNSPRDSNQDVDGNAPEPESVPMTGLRQISDVTATPTPSRIRTQVRVH